MGHLFLLLGTDSAHLSLSCLGSMNAMVVVWGGGSAPARVLMCLALQVPFPWAGNVPCSVDLAVVGKVLLPWHRLLLAKVELWHGHRLWKAPVLVSLPTSHSRSVSRLGQAWGGELAPAGRACAASGSLFATEEQGETAETALALVSPPPARSCPIHQAPRCLLAGVMSVLMSLLPGCPGVVVGPGQC